jgi:hypothetical protein
MEDFWKLAVIFNVSFPATECAWAYGHPSYKLKNRGKILCIIQPQIR